MSLLYTFILVVLAILAVLGIVVGVSNDAVNFLNSAIGSKVTSFRCRRRYSGRCNHIERNDGGCP